MKERTGQGLGALAAAAVVVAAAALSACTGAGRGAAPTTPPPGSPTKPVAVAPATRRPLPGAAATRTPMLPGDPDRGVKEGFVSDDACMDCHLRRDESIKVSFHERLLAGALEAKGCQECHGPGLRHVGEGDVDHIRHPGKIDREASNAVCLRCHSAVLALPVEGHRDWVDGRALACVTCHRVHLDRRAPEFSASPAGATLRALEAAGARPVPASRCVQCHPRFHPEMARSAHADLAEGDGCTTCHGPGSLHADSGGHERWILLPTEQEAREADRSCDACHGRHEKALERWTCSEHRKEGVSCATCHSPNEPLGRTLRKPDPALCVDCHRDTAAEFRMASRHRVLEGQMKCGDCHDPHGNENGFHDAALTRDVCSRCHAEKAGPFVFDHLPKRLDGCVACHRPHGAPSARLLDTTPVRTLCLSCHADLPSSHEQKPSSPYRHCIDCHVEIHGSDSSRVFFR